MLQIVGMVHTASQMRILHRKWFEWSLVEPTGVFCRAGEQIRIHVLGTVGITALVGTERMPFAFLEAPRHNLTPGVNTITVANAGLLYFSREHTGTITVEILSGGIGSPLFVLGRTTQAEWNQLMSSLTQRLKSFR